MVDGDEDPDLAVVLGLDRRAVRRPHPVGRVGDEGLLVPLRLAARLPIRRQERVLPHEPKHALSRRPYAMHQRPPRPDRSVPLADELARREVGAHLREQRRVVEHRHGPTLASRALDPARAVTCPSRVEAGARYAEHLAHAT
jgi:hypothetical protein